MSTSDKIALVGVIAQLIVVGVAVWAVLASLHANKKQIEASDKQLKEQIKVSETQVREQIEENRCLATEEHQHQSRPILVPVGELIPASAMGGLGLYMANGIVNWNYQGKINLELQNMGGGVALNVHCVLYGSDSLYNLQFVSWDNGPIGTNPTQVIIGEHTKKLYLDPGDSIDGIHPIYDRSPTSSANPVEYRIACLTITYHDLFGIKHVSIFNYTLEHRWVCVAIGKIPAIKEKTPLDLKEMNDWKIQHGPRYSAPTP